ncbi:molybdopterin converting factor subunit 1 [Paenibacillus gallinarum]|uniref:Molybdopterin converting factor subunit 1 n=1 Tax=Paenibacillus gallinarum TaxID=2762232 RepID=A0ABR8STX5_9BACL|nr:molybdopterin converting factor subunit 1 [Paenibacillus gallinarum]MBD7966946.1 molybdopterin converting factor subunit 1 [Paenibacillus gallinarum]
MKITVLLFAGIAERIGKSRVELTLAESTTAGQVKEELIHQYPDAAGLIQSAIIAINQEYAPSHASLNAEDEIALIPPVSGGDGTSSGSADNEEIHTTSDGLYTIGYSPLSVEQVTDKVITPNHGAALSFVGTTREMTGDQRTILLEYEAYIPMALSMMQTIGQEIDQRWPGTRCAISHRLGKVGIAEISVVIAVSSPHRADCYDASRYAIERLKEIVPIWKKEVWADGSEWKGHQTGPWNPKT